MKLKHRIVRFIINLVQRFGPDKVNVLGKTYVISKDVFNPKFYFTSIFMATHVSVTSKDDVLDIGTGSGIQAITAGQKAQKVIGIDINPEAVRCAKENVKNNGLENVIKIYQGDLFSPLTLECKFDAILFTPPYMEGPLKIVFDHALNDPNKSLVNRFFREAKIYLKPGGYVQMVYSSLAEPERVLKIASDLGWRYEIMFEMKIIFERFFIYRFELAGGDNL